MIFVECNADKTLVRNLGIAKNEIIHSGNKGDVCNSLKKAKNSKGLVDEDPLSTQPSYIKELKSVLHESGIKLFYHEKNRNHLIVLCPRLEDWILKAVEELELNVEDYSLANDAGELHENININLKQFEKLLEDIKEKSNRMKTLRNLLTR